MALRLRGIGFRVYDARIHSHKIAAKGRLTVSEINDLKKKLAMSSRMLFNSGLVDYSGHISARIPGSDHLLILPHPVSRATVVAGDMVVSDFEGKVIEGKYKAPRKSICMPAHTKHA